MTVIEPSLSESAARERIHASHVLDGDPSELAGFYRRWADSYNVDVEREGYCGPSIVAELVGALQTAYLDEDRSTVRIVDAGCGTGLAGLHLARLGFETIDGFDLSREMAVKARQTGVYREVLEEVDLNQPLSTYKDGSYDIAVCCGVFTLGHVRPSALGELARITRPGGFLLVSTRKSYFDTMPFEAEVSALRRAGVLELTQCLRNGHYVSEEGAHYWVFRVIAATPCHKGPTI